MNTGSYIWKIDDENIIDAMMNAKYKQVFESEIFEMAHLKWQLLVYPNGHDANWKGTFSVRLKPISIPPILSEIVFFRELSILETGTRNFWISKLSEGMTCGWGFHSFYLQKVQHTASGTHSNTKNTISIKASIRMNGLILKSNANTNRLPLHDICRKRTDESSIRIPSKQWIIYNAKEAHISDIHGDRDNAFWWASGWNLKFQIHFYFHFHFDCSSLLTNANMNIQRITRMERARHHEGASERVLFCAISRFLWRE